MAYYLANQISHSAAANGRLVQQQKLYLFDAAQTNAMPRGAVACYRCRQSVMDCEA